MAVLSNKPEKYTIPIISHYFPALKFYSVQGSTSELTKKPKPIKALQIAAKNEASSAINLIYRGHDNRFKNSSKCWYARVPC